MRPQIGRADLLRCLHGQDPEALDALAAAVGYEPRVVIEPKPVLATMNLTLDDFVVKVETTITPPPARTPQAQFLRPLSRRRLTAEEAVHEVPSWYEEAEPFAEDDPEISAPKGARPPRPPPLMPWPRLWPFLKLALGEVLESHRPDLPKLVDAVSQGRWLRRLPRQRWAGWARDCQLLIDFAEPLRPFWGDFNELKARLPVLRGRAGLGVAAFPEGDPLGPCWLDGAQGWERERDYRLPPPGTPVLVLSDLGGYDATGQRRRRWLRFGLRLKAAGCRPVALMPCPPHRWDAELARLFRPAGWDRNARPPRRLGRLPPLVGGGDADAVERLLGLLSPAIRVEPALLRCARWLLPAGQADVGAEAEAWNHPDAHATLAAFYYEPGTAARHRERFRAEPEPLRSGMARLIREHHVHLSPAIALEEARVLALLLERAALEPDEAEPARRFVERLAKTCGVDSGGLGGSARSWIARVGEREQPAEFWARTPGLEAGWVLAHRERLLRGEIQPPPGLQPLRVSWALGGAGKPEAWALWQRGPALIAKPSGVNAQGSLIATLETGVSLLLVSDPGEPDAPERPVPLAGPIPLVELPDRFRLRTDREEWEFDLVTKPDWARKMGRDRQGLWVEVETAPEILRLYWRPPGTKAGESGRSKGTWGCFSALGRDEYGLYADLKVDSVEYANVNTPVNEPLATFKEIIQRFRWIAPGTFLMGSPEDEPERRENESPRHAVTLTRGFWLADTACPQALWEAVMGNNPSRFQDPERPVEQVTWHDAQAFLRKLEGLLPGVRADLPTEAEWEYACRAGTETALYSGPIEILGENNAPALDPIAWYGGNSGVGFDLANGYGSTGWPGKQYPDSPSGTHPVRRKRANPWGLYDMLGNVWEWCADGPRDYGTEPVVDTIGPQEAERARAVRGGSWLGNARWLRSAYRYAFDPGRAFDSLGFRPCLRSIKPG
ncbi:Formylglycine-generating enzyme, required for sulfatase activity, contains SUMF1/FGE domain [Methylomagnum ishizawai]|uniref:Formylglycine-generating enzyme, required for sulfatase activity, contains SUMF1/FGE domain n=1 Tax=Methylomagnum ishizawai TaxID=1760988 RepID=A0A1Y6D0L4_9GAMM|nr:formylglycine-generating enzyme family protein [Methylomagnum ishizawai]SMF96116.1 Formylglycine-generating enzyme, required for sulfatase activity, contains SUMF1/FGE domain [Methylomagnum ishizawai]